MSEDSELPELFKEPFAFVIPKKEEFIDFGY